MHARVPTVRHAFEISGGDVAWAQIHCCKKCNTPSTFGWFAHVVVGALGSKAIWDQRVQQCRVSEKPIYA